ncbi:MAG: mitochondrial fission ELM1 family protein [Alphaproteobacteria bacterium]|nr:mitochondrial fission ELM1 family protein [Alphaproteobacteria bacterium]
MPAPKTCWTITNEFPGMKSQVMGLAEAIGFPTTHKTCKRRWPWGWLGLSWGNSLNQLTTDSDPLSPPWPDVVISCGRRSAALALAIKKQNRGKTFCVHIQDPVTNRGAFDLIVAPEHDNLRGPNVISTKGALHKVTPQKLEEGVRQHGALFQHLPRPYNAVLVGGATNRYQMPREAMEDLIQQILLIRDNTQGSVLVTPSFRTPFREALTKALENEPHVFLANIEKMNPYFAMLGVADAVFVTDDSVNMVCEACVTGKPVYILPLLGHGDTKPKKFIQSLIQQGVVRLFQGSIDSWIYDPFNDTERIAARVRERIQ